ncbi:MAG: DMT family transporter [bacterium]|nr:DMT family transporter [bacterium]MCP4965741.1 DMT family transporter [bacterium]
MPFQVAALLAASSWAVGGLIAAEPSRLLGGPRFVRIRMVYVSVALVLIAVLTGGWSTVEASDWLPLAISGFVGLALGDAALFEAFSRLGPRRTGMLFAANAPITAVLSAIVYDEEFGLLGVLGTILVVSGVSMAIAYGTRPGQSHTWEEVRGSLSVGAGFGLLGALGQSIAVLVADPVFDGILDPWAGAAVRALVGTLGLFALMPWFERRTARSRPAVALTARLWLLVIASGTLGMVVGKTLMLIALAEGPPGVVSILVSLAPVLQLPLIWAITRERPPIGAWFGAGLGVIGTAMVLA